MSRPLEKFTDDQEKKLKEFVAKRFKVFKFLLNTQDIDEYVRTLEQAKYLDDAFEEMGVGGKGNADILLRARGWYLLAKKIHDLLRGIKDTKISRWRELTNGT